MSEGFSAQWLALREARDNWVRSRTLATAFLNSLPPRARILDLGAGTGANARYLNGLAALRGQDIAWRLVDRDAALLDGVTQLDGAVRQVLDFAADPGLLDLAGIGGISASALFDLVSRDWFTQFVTAADGRPLLLALTAHDDHQWLPEDAADAAVMGWFAQDMRRDKGFGPAMGLTASSDMAEILADAGYRVRCEASDWRLSHKHLDMLYAMIDVAAAAATAQGDPEQVAAWRDRRRDCAAVRELKLVVGHRDILALSEAA